MLSTKTRKTIEYINSIGDANSVALSTDGLLNEISDVSMLLRRNDICVTLTNTSGDTPGLYISCK